MNTVDAVASSSFAYRYITFHTQVILYYTYAGSRDSLAGIATRYGLDGPGIESRWGARFSASVQTVSEAHPASYAMSTGSFPGVKRLGRGVDHPTYLTSRFKKE